MANAGNKNPFEETERLVRMTKDIFIMMDQNSNKSSTNNTDNSNTTPDTQVSAATKNVSADTMGHYAKNVSGQIGQTQELEQVAIRANQVGAMGATYRETERQAGREQGKQAEREKQSALEDTTKKISTASISAFGVLSAIAINGILIMALGPFMIPVALLEIFAVFKNLSKIFENEKKTLDKTVAHATQMQKDINIKTGEDVKKRGYMMDVGQQSVLKPADANPAPSSVISVTQAQ